jgi:hypothetical protein
MLQLCSFAYYLALIQATAGRWRVRMKILITLVFLVSMNSVTLAQTSSFSTAEPNVAVVKFSWSKERVGWEQDPFSGPIENFDEMRVRSRNEKRILDAKKGGNSAEMNRAERDARSDDALISRIHQNTRARYGFVYKVSIQNNSSKAIKSVDWDYVFFNSQTNDETGRRQFTSEEKIAPGKTKELKFFIPGPPTQTISVSALNKNERNGLGEAVVIIRVEFADGTSWQR